jgi:disulfide bond formation protein DsbB
MLAKARILALLIPALLLGGALGSQYFGGLVPCEMCMWQRYPHYTALVLAILAILLRRTPLSLPLTVLAGIAILVSGGLGIFHAGVEYKMWKGPEHCTSLVSGSGADLLKAILAAPIVRCDEPQWTMFGISLAGFNAIFSILGGLVVLSLCRRPAR